MNNKKASKESIRENNIGLLLRKIREEKNMTRIKLSKKTGLAKSTISNLVNSLIKGKIVFEGKKAESKMGKKPITLKFNENYCFILAIDIDIELITVAIANSFGKILHKVKVKNHPREDRNQILNNTYVAIEKLLEDKDIDTNRIYVFSIGTHGVVNPELNIITNSPYLPNWNGINLVKIFEKKYKKQVIVENSVNLGALGELWKNYRYINDLVYLDITYGIGAGIIINNKLVTGSKGTMGEISYLPILKKYDYEELKQNKFEIGVFESQVDIDGITKRVKESFLELDESERNKLSIKSDNINFNTICKFYNKNSDNFIRDLINNEIVKILAMGIASIITIIDTEVIVINGEILKLGDNFFNILKNEIYDITPFKPKIEISKLKEEAHIEGAIKNGVNHLDNIFYNHFQLLSKQYKK